MNQEARYLKLSIPTVIVFFLLSVNGGTMPKQIQTPIESDVSIDLVDGISPREAVSIALRQNVGLLALRKGHEVTKAGVSQAKAFSEPELRFGRSGFDDVGSSSSNSDYDIALRWSPPRPGERGLKSDRAMEKVSEFEGEIRDAELRLAAEILFLHTKIVFLDEQATMAEAAVKLREQILEFVESEVQASLKTRLDQNIAELALADARLIPTTYQTERLLCLDRLTSELNLPPGTPLKIQVEGDPLILRTRLLDVNGLIEQAKTSRPELAMASARYSQAQAVINLKKLERYPWFSFFQVGRQFELGSSSDSWGVRVGVELPIFKWNSSTLEEPTIEARRCQMDLETLKRRISLEVGQITTQLRARYKALEYYKQTIDPMINRDLELAEQVISTGTGDRLQYLMAEARRLQRHQAYLSDLLDCRRLEIELDRATGNVLTQ